MTSVHGIELDVFLTMRIEDCVQPVSRDLSASHRSLNGRQQLRRGEHVLASESYEEDAWQL